MDSHGKGTGAGALCCWLIATALFISIALGPSIGAYAQVFDDESASPYGYLLVLGNKVTRDSVRFLVDDSYRRDFQAGQEDALVLQLAKGPHRLELVWDGYAAGTVGGARPERRQKTVYVRPGHYLIVWLQNSRYEYSTDIPKSQQGVHDEGIRYMVRDTLKMTIENEGTLDPESMMYFTEEEIWIGLAKLGLTDVVRDKCLNCRP